MRRDLLIVMLPLASLLMAPRCYSTRPIANPPTYKGTSHATGGCFRDYQTVGREPVNDEDPNKKYPLFLYFVGTDFFTGPGTYYNDGAPLDIIEQMAARGSVALSVSYDNTGVALFADEAGQAQQMNCLFNADEPESLISKACNTLPHVDCSLGIATWGHSQGGRVALRAANFAPTDANGNSLVRAAVAFGVGPDMPPFSIDRSRVRVVDSVGDFTLPSFAPITPADLTLLTGAAPPVDCAESPDQCLRADKSGWVLVGDDVPGIGVGHCWFMSNAACGATLADRSSAAAFLEPNPELPYTLAANADWIQSTMGRP
jgi:dienelactone hydrolase